MQHSTLNAIAGQQIVYDRRVAQIGSNLHIESLQREDAGDYVCIAASVTSGARQASPPAKLSVICEYPNSIWLWLLWQRVCQRPVARSVLLHFKTQSHVLDIYTYIYIYIDCKKNLFKMENIFVFVLLKKISLLSENICMPLLMMFYGFETRLKKRSWEKNRFENRVNGFFGSNLGPKLTSCWSHQKLMNGLFDEYQINKTSPISHIFSAIWLPFPASALAWPKPQTGEGKEA